MNVLLVEDNFVIAMHLQDLVETDGHSAVGPFAKAEEALTALGAHKIHGALLDYSLAAGTTSISVADKLYELGLPFAFVTGQARINIPQRFACVPRLFKPIQDQALSTVLQGFQKCALPSLW